MKKESLVFLFFLFNLNFISYSQLGYVEQNSGVNVNLASVSIDQSIEYVTYKKAWICGNSGTILKTTNAGINWINISGHGVPDSLNLVNIFCVDSNLVLTVGKKVNSYVYRTTNGGTNWSLVFSQPSGFIHAIWMTNSNEGLMYGNPVNGRWSLWKTSNGGANWDSSGMYLHQTGSEWGINNGLASYGSKFWFGSDEHGIYYSSNYGTTWQNQSIDGEGCSSIWFYFADTLFGYSGGYSHSYYTTNYGNSWISISLVAASGFTGVNGIVDKYHSPPTQCWAIIDNTIFRAFNNQFGYSYQAPAGNYTFIGYNRIFCLYSWAVRDNGGVTRIEFNPVSVKQITSKVPNSFSLSQNYPNPFNPITKIQYEIAKNSHVELKIFDATGHQIARLVNGQQTPGTYEAEFDGSGYASGVYFYKIEISDPETSSGLNFSQTKKMVLLK